MREVWSALLLLLRARIRFLISTLHQALREMSRSLTLLRCWWMVTPTSPLFPQLQIDGFSQIKHVYIRMSVLSGVNSVCISNLEQLVTLNVGVSCFSFFETTGIIREGEPIEFGNPKYCPKNSPKSFEVKNNPSLRSLVIGTSCFAETSLCRIAGLFVHSF